MDTRTQQGGKTAEQGTSQHGTTQHAGQQGATTNPGLQQSSEKVAHGGGYGAAAIPASERQPDLGQQRNPYESGAGQVMDQVKEGFSTAYETTSKGINKGYNAAVDYGKTNPGKATLIAFGAGLGVGLMLAGGFSRSRSSRIVPPIMDALSQIATELFR